MKAGQVLLLAVGGLVLWHLSQLGIAAGTVQVLLNGIKFNGLNDIQISMLVQNVSNATVTVNSMAGNVLVNGNQLATISDFQAVTIPGNSQHAVIVHASPSFLSLPATIANLINGSQQAVITASGNMNVNGLVVPFSESDTLSFGF